MLQDTPKELADKLVKLDGHHHTAFGVRLNIDGSELAALRKAVARFLEDYDPSANHHRSEKLLEYALPSSRQDEGRRR